MILEQTFYDNRFTSAIDSLVKMVKENEKDWKKGESLCLSSSYIDLLKPGATIETVDRELFSSFLPFVNEFVKRGHRSKLMYEFNPSLYVTYHINNRIFIIGLEFNQRYFGSVFFRVYIECLADAIPQYKTFTYKDL